MSIDGRHCSCSIGAIAEWVNYMQNFWTCKEVLRTLKSRMGCIPSLGFGTTTGLNIKSPKLFLYRKLEIGVAAKLSEGPTILSERWLGLKGGREQNSSLCPCDITSWSRRSEMFWVKAVENATKCPLSRMGVPIIVRTWLALTSRNGMEDFVFEAEVERNSSENGRICLGTLGFFLLGKRVLSSHDIFN